MAVLTIFYRMNIGGHQKILTGKLVLQQDALRVANLLLYEIRRCSDVVRPHQGETVPFLAARDMSNQMYFVYLVRDDEYSKSYNKELYKIVQYRDTHSGSYQQSQEKTLATAIKHLSFTSLDPYTVQLNLILANDRDEYQILTKVAAMNFGELE